MSIFLLGLLLKIAMTASIVVAASVVVERSGPFVGSLIAALPTAGGAAMIILAFEHPPGFIAQSVVGSLIANAACAVFALTYAWLAQRRSLAVSLSGALAVWLGGVELAQLFSWTMLGVVILNAIIYPLTIWAGTHFRTEGAAAGKVAFTGVDLVWRAAIVTFVVIAVTTASTSIGSVASGAFAFFPIAMSSFFIILHSRIGGREAARVAAHVQAPLIGLGLSFVAVHYLAVPLGVWWSYLIALAIGFLWNALLWTARAYLRRS